jgi:tryptophan 2,3-dioxygenase
MSDDDNESGAKKPKSDSVQIFNPPHLLKHKVKGGGGPSPEMLAKAQEAISKMSDDYPTWAIQDVDRLEGHVATLAAGDETKGEKVREAFHVAHDMRGQGGSFGYPLVTRIANSFCRFTEKMETLDDGAIGILQTHVNALRAVIGNRVSGTGGATGTQIADGLEQAVQKYLQKHGL